MAKRKKTLFKTHVMPYLDKINLWASNGATDKDLYTRLKIGKTSWFSYIKRYPELNELLIHARTYAEDRDYKVVNNVYDCAKGKTIIIKKPIKIKHKKYNENGRCIKEWEEVVQTTEEQYIPPNEKACEYILNNKLSHIWSKDGIKQQDKPSDMSLMEALLNVCNEEGNEEGNKGE